jgi:tungstate transport system ATP-binding protein
MRGVQQEKEKQEVSRALRAVGMEGFDKRYSKTLSGGEAQRIAIARVLAYEPDLILLDEPTANLDPTNTSSVERTILSVKKTYGTTILIATHNMFQAKRLADRVALLFNGKFVETGDPETIFTSPKEATTKAFINGELVY